MVRSSQSTKKSCLYRCNCFKNISTIYRNLCSKVYGENFSKYIFVTIKIHKKASHTENKERGHKFSQIYILIWLRQLVGKYCLPRLCDFRRKRQTLHIKFSNWNRSLSSGYFMYRVNEATVKRAVDKPFFSNLYSNLATLASRKTFLATTLRFPAVVQCQKKVTNSSYKVQ